MRFYRFRKAGLRFTPIDCAINRMRSNIKAGIRANGFIRSNREGSIGFLSGWQRAAPKLAAVTYDSIGRGYNQDGSMPMDGFALVVRDTKELLNVSRNAPLSELFDWALLGQAQGELGLKVK